MALQRQAQGLLGLLTLGDVHQHGVEHRRAAGTAHQAGPIQHPERVAVAADQAVLLLHRGVYHRRAEILPHIFPVVGVDQINQAVVVLLLQLRRTIAHHIQKAAAHLQDGKTSVIAAAEHPSGQIFHHIQQLTLALRRPLAEFLRPGPAVLQDIEPSRPLIKVRLGEVDVAELEAVLRFRADRAEPQVQLCPSGRRVAGLGAESAIDQPAFAGQGLRLLPALGDGERSPVFGQVLLQQAARLLLSTADLAPAAADPGDLGRHRRQKGLHVTLLQIELLQSDDKLHRLRPFHVGPPLWEILA